MTEYQEPKVRVNSGDYSLPWTTPDNCSAYTHTHTHTHTEMEGTTVTQEISADLGTGQAHVSSMPGIFDSPGTSARAQAQTCRGRQSLPNWVKPRAPCKEFLVAGSEVYLLKSITSWVSPGEWQGCAQQLGGWEMASFSQGDYGGGRREEGRASLHCLAEPLLEFLTQPWSLSHSHFIA